MKFKIVLILLITLTGTLVKTQAQPILRHDARHCIRRTGLVLIETQAIVREGKVYTGDFARAVAHQRYAKKLFAEGKFLRAIHQSIRARHLAWIAIQANKGVIKGEWRMDADESKYEKSLPPTAELDKEVPDASKQKDESLINVDIKDVNMEEKE